jgi:hypothetical protein
MRGPRGDCANAVERQSNIKTNARQAITRFEDSETEDGETEIVTAGIPFVMGRIFLLRHAYRTNSINPQTLKMVCLFAQTFVFSLSL